MSAAAKATVLSIPSAMHYYNIMAISFYSYRSSYVTVVVRVRKGYLSSCYLE